MREHVRSLARRFQDAFGRNANLVGMISGKDLLGQFKAASWAGPEEIESFVADAGSPAPQDLLKLLDVALGRSGDAAAQRARLTVFARLLEKNPDKSRVLPPGVPRAIGGSPFKIVPVALPRLAIAPEKRDFVIRDLLVADARDVEATRAKIDAARRQAPVGGLSQVAARALMQMGGSKMSFEMLTAMAGERDFPGRAEALDVLVSFARTQAVPALQAALAVGTQAEKVLALKHLGDPKALEREYDSRLPVKEKSRRS